MIKQDFHKRVRAPQIPQGRAGEVGQDHVVTQLVSQDLDGGLSDPKAFAFFAPPHYPKQRGL